MVAHHPAGHVTALERVGYHQLTAGSQHSCLCKAHLTEGIQNGMDCSTSPATNSTIPYLILSYLNDTNFKSILNIFNKIMINYHFP